jgi:hypothetical protein
MMPSLDDGQTFPQDFAPASGQAATVDATTISKVPQTISTGQIFSLEFPETVSRPKTVSIHELFMR